MNKILTQPDLFSQPVFHGSNYVPRFDLKRLTGQIKKLHELMKDGGWRTLDEISSLTGIPAASASALLRALKKESNGGFVLEKRPRGERVNGYWEYRILEKSFEVQKV